MTAQIDTVPPDFTALKQRFNQLKPGPQADVRRVATPKDLAFVPTTYHLLPPGQEPNRSWFNVIFFLPHIKHRDEALSLGAQLRRKDINEMRLFQVLRSESPNDLIYLRRIVQHIEPTVNWERFGKSIFHWDNPNQLSKRQLLQDFFLAGQAS
jgi:CRISPR system Cascade subunit CasB